MPDLSHLPAITGPFTERWRRSKQDEHPSVYRYDVLPPEFRVQVAMILRDTLGAPGRARRSYSHVGAWEPSLSDVVWERVYETIAFHRGVFNLVDDRSSHQDAVIKYLQKAETLPLLDAIEVAFALITSEPFRELSDNTRAENGMNIEPDDAIDLLNRAFRRHDLGYFFVNEMIVRVDQTFLHDEVAEPAIALMHEAEFKSALDEFLKAHQHYRRGEIEDAITDANNAFESVLKTIGRRLGLALTGKERTEQLIDTVMGVLVPTHMKTYFDGLRSAMKGLPVLRNNTPSAAHGRGDSQDDVVDHAAGFALHLTAANIQFLIQALRDHERKSQQP